MTSSLPINIERLLRFEGIESNRVEFKTGWSEPTQLQVLHTICAFANDFQNLNGGYIVLGVRAPDGQAELPPLGLDPRELEKVQQRIRVLCKTRLDPEYQPVMSPQRIEGRNILVIWVPGSETRPHLAAERLDSPGERSHYIRLGPETVKATGTNRQALMELAAKVPFDERRAHNAEMSHLRDALAREFLRDVGSDLATESSATEMFRRMRVTVPVNDHEVPRNIGLLFFTDDADEWFHGARIEVVQFPAEVSGSVLEEQVFRGPLQQQIRNCLRYLEGFAKQHIEKVPDHAAVRGWVSYPLHALRESIVNAVYHRSYDGVLEPTKIYLYPDRIEITSYPGPVPGIERDHLERGGRIPPVPARNRRIGEFLKELRLAEGRGTGIPRVYRSMEENGSPDPVFDFDDARSYFRVTLPAHPDYSAILALRDAAHLRAIGDTRAARQRLETAFSRQPGSGVLAAALIEDYARTADLDRILTLRDRFEEAKLRTSPARMYVAAATAFLDGRRLEDAKRMLRALPEFVSAEEAWNAAIVARRADRQDQAHQLFEKAGQAVFEDVRALHEFAQTKMRLAGNLRNARSRFDRDARVRLLRESRDMLQRVIQMDAPPTRLAWAWYDLGRVLGWLRAPKSEIRRAFREACDRLPEEERFRKELERVGQE